ncbi:hypothetical protein BDV96DRAFT_645458 [Lophiotrema nucula]|uniref:Uncharacterized protein n=1 Tax=Lophiotrema nucula TaxID=690887 RepID=A0A6A5ZB41_9PLEO|nr:hypothetical protein BDV96DRAFT_645458 [Lophiotrema nucula]
MGDEQMMERCTSYGRGGAGNMRRQSTVTQAQEKLASMAENVTDTVTPSRRRSSVWSRASQGSWKDMFRRGSVTEDSKGQE